MSAAGKPTTSALLANGVLASNAPVRMHQYQRTIVALSATVAMSNDIAIRSARRRGAIGKERSPASVSRYAIAKSAFVHGGMTVPGFTICVYVAALEPIALNSDAVMISSHARCVA